MSASKINWATETPESIEKRLADLEAELSQWKESARAEAVAADEARAEIAALKEELADPSPSGQKFSCPDCTRWGRCRGERCYHCNELGDCTEASGTGTEEHRAYCNLRIAFTAHEGKCTCPVGSGTAGEGAKGETHEV